jgi:sporulation protein YlmC with PRC-barrel domain
MAHASTPQGGEHRSVLSMAALRNKQVRNPSGEDLGKIEDIMLDEQSGCVAYAVLSFGGFLGMGDKLFAIPWEELRLDQEARTFVLNVSEDVLKDAPGFDNDSWPDFGDPQWTQKVHSHYGRTPYWKEGTRPEQRPPRA